MVLKYSYLALIYYIVHNIHILCLEYYIYLLNLPKNIV